jgi:hypothetical protein
LALVGRNFSRGPIFLDKKQEWEWCVHVLNIKSDGLAMVLFQMCAAAITIIVHKDVPLGLVSINKQHKGKDTESSETHSRLKANEKPQTIKCQTMVRAHKQDIAGFKRLRHFDARWGPSQLFEQRPLKRR